MTLANTLLEKLDSWKPAGEGPHSFAFLDPATGTSVQLTAEAHDALSCKLAELGVTRPAADVAAEPSLKAWAERVAGRVTGLLEPLKLLEVDADRGQALLRSEPPTKRDNDRHYYEVLLQRTGTASVRRYKGSTQPVKREQVGFTLTREALAKLVGDLAARK